MIWVKLLLAPGLVVALVKWICQLLGPLMAHRGIADLWQPFSLTALALTGLFALGWLLPKKKRTATWILAVAGLLLFVAEVPEPVREWKSPRGGSTIIDAGEPESAATRIGRAAVFGVLYFGGWLILLRSTRGSVARNY